MILDQFSSNNLTLFHSNIDVNMANNWKLVMILAWRMNFSCAPLTVMCVQNGWLHWTERRAWCVYYNGISLAAMFVHTGQNAECDVYIVTVHH